jgi:hypothetical protein
MPLVDAKVLEFGTPIGSEGVDRSNPAVDSIVIPD